MSRRIGWLALLLATAAIALTAIHAPTPAPAARRSAARSPAPAAARVDALREVNYYPADDAWTYMWTRWNPARIRVDFERIHLLGANTVRIFVEPGTFGFPVVRAAMRQRFAQVLALAAGARLRVHVTLFDWWSDYRDLAGSRTWAASLLGPFRHDPRIAVVEVKNEVAPTDGAELSWARAMLPDLRTLMPDALTTVSVANISPARFRGVMRALPGDSAPDFWSYHYYGPADDALNRLRALQADAGARPLFVGETGLSTTVGPGDAAARDAAQASYLRAVFAAARRLGLPPPAPWMLNDLTPSAIPAGAFARPGEETGFGLFSTDGAPKPAAAVIARAFGGRD